MTSRSLRMLVPKKRRLLLKKPSVKLSNARDKLLPREPLKRRPSTRTSKLSRKLRTRLLKKPKRKPEERAKRHDQRLFKSQFPNITLFYTTAASYEYRLKFKY